MKHLFTLVAVLLAAGLSPARADEAVERIQACIDMKAPEGMPLAGELRDRMEKEMAGGPQACIGLVQNDCIAAGRERDACVARETNAWLAALTRDDLKGKRAAVWRKGVAAVKAQAVALCESAAAGSAWGGEKGASKGRFGFKTGDLCVRGRAGPYLFGRQ